MPALFIILVSLMMTIFSEKVLISNRCISGLMSNLIKKSWTDSNVQVPFAPMNLVLTVAKTNTVHYALRLGSRVEALTTAQQQ